MAANPGQDSVRPGTPNLAGAFRRGAGLQGLSLAQPAVVPEMIDLTSGSAAEQAAVPADPINLQSGAADPAPATRPDKQRRTSGSRTSTSRSQPRRRTSPGATERPTPDLTAREQTAIWVEIASVPEGSPRRHEHGCDEHVLAAPWTADRTALVSTLRTTSQR
jgi:hypothetical protein